MWEKDNMKIYYCKICEKRNKKFIGTKQELRKHIREFHNIKHELSKQIGKMKI